MTGREKTAVRRQQIVEITLDLLAEVPLAELTTRRIASQLTLSQPALFRHFRSREELLLAVLEHARATLGGLIDAALAQTSDPMARFEALAAGLFSYTEAHPGLPRLLFSDLGPALGGPELRAALRHLVSAQRAIAQALAADAQRHGLLRTDLDLERVGAFFVGLVQGAILQWELDDRARPLTREAGPLVRLWLEGVAPAGTARAAVQHSADRAQPAVSPDRSPPPRPAMLRVLDARPLLAQGIDPLDAILAELDAAGPGGLLCLTAPFRPAPLITLLSERGHHVEVHELGPRAFSVEIVVGGAPRIVDLTDLEPPEPLERVLAAASQLAPGAAFAARLPRLPRLLLPHLDARGLVYGFHERPDGLALLHLRRPL